MMRFKTKTVVVCIGVLAALFSIGCNTSSPSSVDGEKSNSETIESDGTNESIAFYDEHNTDLMTWDSLPEEMRNAPQITDEDNSLKKTTYSNYLYHIGNFGGKGGHSFSIRPPAGSALYAIGIASSDKYVHRLCIWYRRNDGRIFMGLNEGTIWNGTYYIQFFDSGEYIRGVSGRADRFLNRIQFLTNKKSFSYGSYRDGYPFSFTFPLNQSVQVLGFNGRAGQIIDQIGFDIYCR